MANRTWCYFAGFTVGKHIWSAIIRLILEGSKKLILDLSLPMLPFLESLLIPSQVTLAELL